MEPEGRETCERRVPSTFEEASELRDASATLEERDYCQEERVYRLRRGECRSRGVRFEESARRIERSRNEALRAGDQDDRPPWWKRVLVRGGGEKRGPRASFCELKLPCGGATAQDANPASVALVRGVKASACRGCLA